MKRLAALAAVALLTACAQPSTPSPTATPPARPVVFAAASLSTVFPTIAPAQYSFDGSSGLVDQLKGGARADVFASADKKNMDKAVEAGLIDGTPTMFATNALVLITPADNPAHVTGFDASLTGTKLVVCAAEVPCGAAATKAAQANGLSLRPVSEETKVTDVLGKVSSGEADAGLVYATDAATAGAKVTVFEIASAKTDPNTYWIGVVAGAPNKAGATSFIATVMGEGQATLKAAGFGPPK